MKKIAIYGKGGIGKSTCTSSVAAALSSFGLKVMQIGCDPKADSSINILNGKKIIPVMDFIRQNGVCNNLNDIVQIGYGGVICVEAGGPIPGKGCAGRGIMATFEILDKLHAFEVFKPDVILFDVLGDVVCGGFAAPIRENYADEVYIVTSGEKMAFYAANNIYQAISGFQGEKYATAKGIILNRRNVENETEFVEEMSNSMHLPIVADIPRDKLVQTSENKNMTVVQAYPESSISEKFMDLAQFILNN